MKKQIGFVNLDVSVLKWLTDKMREVPSDLDGAVELREALMSLCERSSDSLMIEVDASENLPTTGSELRCGDLSIFVKARKVLRSGEEVILTPKEFDILYFLARNRGEVFTKEQIYRSVWENEHVMDDSNIMAFIRKLRKKIEPNPDAPIYILTVWGIGYKFSDRV